MTEGPPLGRSAAPHLGARRPPYPGSRSRRRAVQVEAALRAAAPERREEAVRETAAGPS
ncbi:hypothetical protein ACFYTV_29590 [Streptomyces sp. NPDC004562]|uniref:hypothetical protein n=1 Tax=Streptomyces sp. NPDC004562 TaxID=3364703 RepID=UPI0036822EA4